MINCASAAKKFLFMTSLFQEALVESISPTHSPVFNGPDSWPSFVTGQLMAQFESTLVHQLKKLLLKKKTN